MCRAAADVTSVRSKPGLLKQARAVVVSGISQLVADRRAERTGIATSVQNDWSAGIARVAIDSLQLAAVPVEVIGTIGLSSGCRRILRNPLNENDRQVPPVGVRFAEDVITRPFGRKTPVVAS